MDESYSIYNNGAVAIQGDSIIAVGETARDPKMLLLVGLTILGIGAFSIHPCFINDFMVATREA